MKDWLYVKFHSQRQCIRAKNFHFILEALQSYYPYAFRNAPVAGTYPSPQRRYTATATQSGETKGVLVLRTHLNARKYITYRRTFAILDRPY
jgi:hypothetical protein